MQVGLRVRVRENLEGSQKTRPSVLGVGSSAMPCQASSRPIGRCSTECDSKLGARSGDKVVPPQYWAIRVVTRDWKDEDE